ncbi:MAG: DUF5667 domain-containing protein [Anaerolineales bacterium]|nr:DUF5667 domain-containing protein [Anaerolineales bacterium]
MSKMEPDVLDRCLLRIQSGQATLEECLIDNPEHAQELEALLRVAAVTHAQLAPAGPSQTFLAHSPKRVMNLVRARLKTSTPSRRRRPVWIGQSAYRLAGVLLALALLIGSVGVAYASADALPGDNLYGIKRGLERAALVVSLSAEGDAELWLEQADRRIAEVEELVRRGRGKDVGLALAGYENAVREGLEIASEQGVGLSDLGAALSKHEQTLIEVLEKAPEQAAPALSRALERSKSGREEIKQIRKEGQHPSDPTPGPQKKTPKPKKEATELPPGQQKIDEARERGLPAGQLKKTETAKSNGSD